MLENIVLYFFVDETLIFSIFYSLAIVCVCVLVCSCNSSSNSITIASIITFESKCIYLMNTLGAYNAITASCCKRKREMLQFFFSQSSSSSIELKVINLLERVFFLFRDIVCACLCLPPALSYFMSASLAMCLWLCIVWLEQKRPVLKVLFNLVSLLFFFFVAFGEKNSPSNALAI